MSEKSYLFEKKERNWLMSFLKLVFILVAFLLVGITVLANMGGNSDGLKSSVSSFISSAFRGRPTTIDKLVYMSFFPRLGFDVEGVQVLSRPENGYRIVEIGKIQIYMGFWNVAMRKPRVTQFYLKDFKAIKGAVGPKEFYIEKIFIDHDIENGTAKLRGNGEIGTDAWSFNIAINVDGSKGKYNYTLKPNASFIFDLSDIHSEGFFVKHVDGYFKFQDLRVTYGDIDISGNVIISALGKSLLKLKADIKSQNDEGSSSVDVVFDYTNSPIKVEGNILSDAEASSQNNSAENILAILFRFRDIVGYEDIKDGENDNSYISKLFDFSNVKLTGKSNQAVE